MGALRALGLRAVDSLGQPIADGGAGLIHLAAVDKSGLAPVVGGITLLTDVTSPLAGDDGAAVVFAPQKGATPDEVVVLDAALGHLADVLGFDQGTPGAGAAGGAAYGFAAVYGAKLVSGADQVALLVRLDARIRDADLVLTGEGAFDHQSLQGKLVGSVLSRAKRAGTASAVIAGVVRESPGVPSVSLVDMVGSTEAALADPARWAAEAAASLARSWNG